MKKQTKQSAERKALMKEKLAARDAVNRHNTATSTAVVAAAAKAATKAVVEAVRQEAVPDSRLRKSDLAAVAAVAAGAVQALTAETKNKKHKGTSETRSETARRMILAGKTDAQVLDALIELHGLDPAKHKYYPRWYRNELVRDGKLSKTRAKMNA